MSDKTNTEFLPSRVTDESFLDTLTEGATKTDQFRDFFSKCAYVAERLEQTDLKELIECFPPTQRLPRIRLQSEALPESDGHIVGLENYQDDSRAFKEA